MDIDRRSFLAGIGSLGLTEPWGRDRRPPAGPVDPSARNRWHPLTRALLDRAMAGGQPDRARAERTIHELADARGRATRPIIKWTDSPSAAFDHLSLHGLDALLQMSTSSFWCESLSPDVMFAEDLLERSFELRCLAAEICRVDEWDRALMAPKLSAKPSVVAANASMVFRTRAVAAQIGWLETSLPAAAAEALCNVEMLLASGFPERSMPIHHQLLAFRAWECGLLATWETPTELFCVGLPPGAQSGLRT